MQGIIIVNQNVGHNQYKIDRLKEEAKQLDICLDVFVNDGSLAIIKDNNITINLPKADFVLYFDKDIYLARLLDKAGYRLFNRPDFIKLCDDKMLTFIACSNKGIKMPTTMAGPLLYLDIKEENYKFLQQVITQIGFPMVVKKVYGSLGEGVYLVHNQKELKDLYKEIYRNPILFQQYIPSSYGSSIRVLVVNGRILGAFHRVNKDDFRSNYGENASSVPLEEEYREICYNFVNDIINKLNIEYAGIDLLLDQNQQPVLCEINSNAFFEEFEKVTKINVAKEILKMVIERTIKEKHE